MLARSPRRLSFGVLAAGAAISLPLALAAQDDGAPPPDADQQEAAPESGELAPEAKAALDRMSEVIAALDGDAQRTGNNWQFKVEERMIVVVTDTDADRMRIITPIAAASELPEGAMERLMQANFDTALDARYAIGQGLVWGAFVHPLDSLTTRDFASGILQTKSLADTFGTTFSSGVLNYGGGDSGAIIERQLNDLLEELDERQRRDAI
ncbi:hypothetical protein [Erythrobacter rubeus]|uniref:Uncharacterized protein n=1 Tax=Erythrobacter rubeus TaxID=2760803 RepID=A0ABR8KNW3_9SPHN|nr:hypothetical protein [Erythrobacter rubeus]MBD2840920.1 hypothetical protein [Erythrobacter rubeus]